MRILASSWSPPDCAQWYNKKIQEFTPEWYTQFHFVIAGLDNIEARAWLNNVSPC
jgi:hypothetical protein